MLRFDRKNVIETFLYFIGLNFMILESLSSADLNQIHELCFNFQKDRHATFFEFFLLIYVLSDRSYPERSQNNAKIVLNQISNN